MLSRGSMLGRNKKYTVSLPDAATQVASTHEQLQQYKATKTKC